MLIARGFLWSPSGALAWLGLALLLGPQSGQGAQGSGWLSSPLASWNAPNARVPSPPTPSRNSAGVRGCQLARPATPSAHAVAAAGWTPYLHLDRELVRSDVEIVGGLTDVTADCGPATFNLFVFVGGTFAGTLSPEPMTYQTDGAAGAVRLLPDGMLSAEFARYAANDTPCCPSSRVTVRYNIDRTPGAHVVIPVAVRTTR